MGSTFTIEVFKENEDPVQASFALGSVVVDPDGLDDLGLFREKVVLEFDKDTLSTSRAFQALHRGETILTIDPTEDSLPTVRVKLVVYQPEQLAGDRHTLDSSFFVLAHRYGVPPQFIKAQVEREADKTPDQKDYVRESYRYEPLNLKTGDLNVSRRDNLRQFESPDQPYGLYRLATIADALNHTDTVADNKDDCQQLPDPDSRIPNPSCVGLDQGTKTIPEDKLPRVRAGFIIPVRDPSTGKIVTDPQTSQPLTRPIRDGDEFISARDIYEFNDTRGAKMNWSNPQFVPREQLAGRVAQLEFTAQTSLAASYGLFQFMYVTAIDEKKWPGTPLGQNPSLLFDTEENIRAGGGTLTLAMRKVADDYGEANKLNVDAGSPSTRQRLLELFKNGYSRYNDAEGYATNIVDERSPSHFPVANRPIFPPGTGGQEQ